MIVQFSTLGVEIADHEQNSKIALKRGENFFVLCAEFT
jgi:hypothetical protein